MGTVVHSAHTGRVFGPESTFTEADQWEQPTDTVRKTMTAASQIGKPTLSYMVELQMVISEIMIELNRVAQTDRVKTEQLKNQYQTLTHERAGLTITLSNRELATAIVSFAASLIQVKLTNPAYIEIAKTFATQVCPAVGGIFASSVRADSDKVANLAQLVLQEYTAKSQSGQNGSQQKQELLATLREALQAFRELK